MRKIIFGNRLRYFFPQKPICSKFMVGAGHTTLPHNNDELGYSGV